LELANEKAKKEIERLQSEQRSNPFAEEMAELKKSQNMRELEGALEEAANQREVLEAQKRALKERIGWFEANWATRRSYPEMNWAHVQGNPLPPPPAVLLHPSPLFVPPGTVFPKPTPQPMPARKAFNLASQKNKPVPGSITDGAPDPVPPPPSTSSSEESARDHRKQEFPPSLLAQYGPTRPVCSSALNPPRPPKLEMLLGKPAEKEKDPPFVRRLTASDPR
ncbi:hypothetical protein PMAYCL1PPCAC_27948, partial [Pristionchus mayeri]